MINNLVPQAKRGETLPEVQNNFHNTAPRISTAQDIQVVRHEIRLVVYTTYNIISHKNIVLFIIRINIEMFIIFKNVELF